MNLITSAALLEPHHLCAPAPWAGHIPFGSWIVAEQKPGTLVELGTYSGISYLAFCQAIREQGLDTKAYAVDTWQGDAHAGVYGEAIHQALQRAHDPRYAPFSRLLRMTFDEALPQFADGSVDLLHIDGLHTYEAVRHDFETWLPKLSRRGVVLLHDTNVFRDDFGVHRLWAEVSEQYPSMAFTHSNGLGVLLVGPHQPAQLVQLCSGPLEQGRARQVFCILGARLEQRAEVLVLQNQLHDAREREARLEQAGRQRHDWIENLDRQVLDLQNQLRQAEGREAALQQAGQQRHDWIETLDRQVRGLQDQLCQAREREALLEQASRQRQAQVEALERQVLDLQDQQRQAREHETLLEQAGRQRQAQVEALGRQVLDLQDQQRQALEREALLEQAGRQRQDRLEALEQRVLDLQQRNAQAGHTIDQLNHQLEIRDGEARQSSRQAALADEQLAAANRQLAAQKALVQEIHASRSWRATAGLRAAGRLARRWGVDAWWRRARAAAAYARRGEWRALAARVATVRREAAVARQLDVAPGGIRRVGVMATQHTLFVAHSLANALQKAGFTVDVMTEPPGDGFALDAYFIVCPQMFERLPPGEKRIAYQMEQSVSSRWFTPEYLATLENSLAVLDYAQVNLRFLQERGIAYPHTYLVPVGGFAGYPDYLRRNQLLPVGLDAPCDVLFYGDANAPRRRQLLAAIGERYPLRVVGNLFGPPLRRALASARVIVNLHYYEGALLETTRIHECLSLGLAVVSETSADQAEHTLLNDAVRFVPAGDVPALLQAIGEVLGASAQESAAARAAREAAVAASQTRFEFMLYRMLLARRWLDYPRFQQLVGATPLPGARLALSLPETTARRAMFVSHQAAGVHLFDGLRYSPGWVGCALSYKYLAQQALAAGSPQLEVMEDDVLFPPGYARHKAAVDEYLASRAGRWDVFAGLMAIVHPDTRVLAVERHGGLTFVTIDRMMSMVHNIYAPAALRLLARWDETRADPETNTIDRYLQTQDQLRVVTTLPFLVGHHEDLHSSLWGIQNSHYAEIIAAAQAALQAKVQAFEQRQQQSAQR